MYEQPKCNRYILLVSWASLDIVCMLYKIFTPSHQLLMIVFYENKINPQRYVLRCVKHPHQFIRDYLHRFCICCWCFSSSCFMQLYKYTFSIYGIECFQLPPIYIPIVFACLVRWHFATDSAALIYRIAVSIMINNIFLPLCISCCCDLWLLLC